MSPRVICVVTCGRIFIFLKAEQYFIVCIYIFFMHSSMNEHLGCFHILAIVSEQGSASSFEILISILLGTYPGVGLLGHMVVLFLSF